MTYGGATDTNCVSSAKGLCFECVEEMYSVLDGCAACGEAQRCVNAERHLLCRDSALLVASQCAQSAQQNALLVVNNHAVKCGEGYYADGETCGECTSSCAMCHNGSSCSICDNTTLQSSDDTCAPLGNAVVQTHTGAVACLDGFFAVDMGCVACDSVFGDGCVSCSAHECLSCKEEFVLAGGICRKGDLCATANGTACTSCADGAVHFNATDCAPTGDCVVYADGVCVQCVTPLILDANGTCAETPNCTVHGDGVCLRCADGMFADENSVCQRLSPRNLTPSMR